MSEQYYNVKKFFENIGYELLTPEEEYINNKKIYKTSTRFIYRCKNNHEREMTIASFNNKKTKSIDTEDFCVECIRIKQNEQKKKELQKLITNGHQILNYENNKNVKYQCGNCNFICQTTSINLLRSTSTKFCHKCQNDRFKLLYDDIKKRVELMGMKLLLKEDEYENNKQLLPILCVCGKEYKLKLADIERGRQCIFCKNGKNEQICREIFERLTKKPFVNSRPKWLNGLELDGYNEDLQIAWEYNGKQHYQYVPEFFHKNGIEEFYSQQKRDQLKTEKCESNHVNLLIIPYTMSKDLVELELFIKKFLECNCVKI
jgi:hypothetical protein